MPVKPLSSALAPVFVLVLLSVTSCTKTIVETHEVPVQVFVHDTAHGPTLMRFISMMPDSRPLYIKKNREGSAPIFLSIASGSTPQYIIIPDSGIVYYLFRNIDVCYDSLPLPAYSTPNSLHTCAIFSDSGIDRFSIVNDSAKFHPAPAGKCYIRFANGIAQYPPSGPQLFLDMDSMGNSPFSTEGGQAIPVVWGTMNEYTLAPAGAHNVLIRSDQKSIGSISQNFEAGGYYTVRVFGQYPPTLQIAVDQD